MDLLSEKCGSESTTGVILLGWNERPTSLKTGAGQVSNLNNPEITNPILVPKPGEERIVALDALRGFALLGILLVNIMSFSGINALSEDPAGAVDQAVQGFIKFFLQVKFLSLFALLFGISFTLQLARLRETGVGMFPTYWRRLVVLFLFGMLHTLLDPAEVLAVYALCGSLLLLFWKAPWKVLVLVAIVLMGAPYLHTAIVTPVYVAEVVVKAPAGDVAEIDSASGTAETTGGEEVESSESAVAEEEEEPFHTWNPYLGGRAIKAHSTGTFTDVVTYSYQFTAKRWTSSWVNYLWMTVPLPLMLLGLLIGRSGVLARLGQEKSRLKKIFWLGLGSGVAMGMLVVVLFELASKSGWNPWIGFPANWLFALSGLVMALAYAAGLLLLLQLKIGERLQAALGPVGRMALTNYLLQTVVCISLFYGFGLGLYGKLGASQAALLAAVIFALQIVFSKLWLSAFQFGPIEWLWRMATYWRVLPLRKA